MPKNKEYELAIKIAGEIEKSFYESTKLTKKELQSIAREAVQTGSMAAKFWKGLEGAEPAFRQLEKVSDATFSAIKAGAAAAAAAVSGIATASMAVGMNFEEQMSTVQAISMSSGEEMEALCEEAKALGRATKFSAAEVGQGFEYMAMAGWKTEDMLAGIDGVLSLAAASGEDLGAVSDIVTDAMTAFGMGADEVNRFADVLAVAASSSNTNVSMMGETFKYVAPLAGALKYSAEDTALAIGLMANSGIKASQAGTALRSMLSRLTKPTKEVREAMQMLDLSLTDENGDMKTLLQLQKDIREGFKGMDPSRASEAASKLAGQEAMSGLLAIVNATEEDFDSLTEAINNSAGAAEKMAGIRIDNLKGDLTILRSAAEGFGIEMYEGMSGLAREAVQYATGFLGELTESASKKLPTARREIIQFSQGISELAGPVITLGKWLADNPGAIVGPIAGIGTAVTAYKAASGVASLAGAITKMTGAGWALMGIGGVVGLIAGIGTAVKKSAEEAKRANLAAHFGDISLSISELQETAAAMIQSQNLDQLQESIAAMSEVSAIGDDIRAATRELDKLDWKVSVGMELTDSEREEYQRQVESFVASTQEFLAQDQYALSLSVRVLFGDDTANANEIVGQIDDYFTKQQQELESKRLALNDIVVKANEDNQISPEEAKEIASLREEIAQIQRNLTGNEFESQLDVIEAKYGGKSLNADSVINLFNEVQKQREAQMGTWEENYASVMEGYRAMLSGGGYTQEEYESRVGETTKAYLQQKADALITSTQRELDMIRNAYGEEYADLVDQVRTGAGEHLEYMLQNIVYAGSPNVHLDFLGENIVDDMKVDRATRDAFVDLYSPMATALQEFQELQQQMKELGMEIPEMNEVMDEMASVGVVTGDENAAWQLLGDIAEADKYQEYFRAIKENNGYMPEVFAERMEENQQAINLAVQQSYDEAREIINQTYGKGFDIIAPVNLALETVVTTGVNMAGRVIPHKDGGIFDRPHLGLIAEAGYPEAAIPIDGSQNAIDLWRTTGELLGMEGLTGGAEPIADNIENAALYSGTGMEIQVVYNPTFHIDGNLQSREDIEDLLMTDKERLVELLEEIAKDNFRTSFR